MSVFFTADLHFYHSKVIQYSNRPFSSVEKMNDVLIGNWNRIVQPQDTVYVLGDFSFAPQTQTEDILRKLNGKKHLVKGNHDGKETIRAKGWESVRDYQKVHLQSQTLILSHYPMRVWEKSHYGSIMIHGHSHGSLPGNSQSLDVGVDCWDYKPCNLEQIKQRLALLPLHNFEDRHKPRK